MRLVISTAPAQEAPKLARKLVEESLVACVNIIPGVRSIYKWEGKICDDEESVMFLKTTEGAVRSLCDRLADLHSYDVPEIIVIDIRGDEGNFDYHAWMRECVEG